MHQRLQEYSMKAWTVALQVSRSGYYAWRKRIQNERTEVVEVAEIKTIYQRHKQKIGAPCMRAELVALGYQFSERTVGRRMACLGLRAKLTRKFRHCSNSKIASDRAPNLLTRNFTTHAPNHVWVGDITYLKTTQGWLYLAVFIDLFNRQVVGWQMSHHIDSALVNDSLKAALLTRAHPKNVMIHTDQGSQYTAFSFVELMKKHRLTQSMSRRGNCWDNAVAESFFAGLKKHTVHGFPLTTRIAMRARIFEYIEIYYNRVRRHSANGWQTPVEFERLYNQKLETTIV